MLGVPERVHCSAGVFSTLDILTPLFTGASHAIPVRFPPPQAPPVSYISYRSQRRLQMMTLGRQSTPIRGEALAVQIADKSMTLCRRSGYEPAQQPIYTRNDHMNPQS
jgi:hypothetical protein